MQTKGSSGNWSHPAVEDQWALWVSDVLHVAVIHPGPTGKGTATSTTTRGFLGPVVMGSGNRSQRQKSAGRGEQLEAWILDPVSAHCNRNSPDISGPLLPWLSTLASFEPGHDLTNHMCVQGPPWSNGVGIMWSLKSSLWRL